MWIWVSELHRLGFRRRSDHYWQCERRYGLSASSYLSIFVDAHEVEINDANSHRQRVDFSAFHVTFLLGPDRVHFYYHELSDLVFEPGGHTSLLELLRYVEDPFKLRSEADEIAGELAAAMGVVLLPRDWQ